MSDNTLSKESYAQLIDSIVDIVHVMNISIENIKRVAPPNEIRFVKRAIGKDALASLMEAVWEIEDKCPELNDYYLSELAKRSENKTGNGD